VRAAALPLLLALAAGATLLAVPRAARALPDAGSRQAPYREASLTVKVGATASEDVGYANGLVCDDLTIITARLEAESPSSNRLYVTGVKPGSTSCRAGTAGVSPVVLVRITVERP
jgi:hypothetical protein